MNKKCNKCGKTKLITEFSFKNKKLRIRHSDCKECHGKWFANYYHKNRDKQLREVFERKKRHADEIRKFLYMYLLEHSCVDCPETDPVVMHFDHMGNKEFNIGNAVNRGVSLETLKKEIAKCVIRCANCHAKKTAKDRSYYKTMPR